MLNENTGCVEAQSVVDRLVRRRVTRGYLVTLIDAAHTMPHVKQEVNQFFTLSIEVHVHFFPPSITIQILILK